jgi:hypothetical protein
MHSPSGKQDAAQLTQFFSLTSPSPGYPVDMAQWFNLWSFDVMGDLAFGKSFGMLDSAETH